MKKMKLAAIFAGLVSVFTFSSCLNDGDSGSNYDLYEIVTVEEGSIFGGTVLKLYLFYHFSLFLKRDK